MSPESPAIAPGAAHQHSGSGREGWQDELRAKGYRLTPQRELVLSAVERLGHATPDDVLTAVREQSAAINISTVYRTLELLEQLGFVGHTHLTDRAPTYHSKAAPEHVHLVCRECGAVHDAELREFTPLAEELLDRHGFAVDLGHLTVFGRCTTC